MKKKDGSLPGINSLVDVRIPDGREFASRVEDINGDALTLAAPFGAGVEPPELGTTMEMCWTSQRGRHIVATRLAEIKRGMLSSWVVQLDGEIHLLQRRKFVRGGGGEPIQVHLTAEQEAGVLAGRVVDISEGGLRCWLDSGKLSCDFAGGETVTAVVGLEGDQIAIHGEVLRVSAEPAQPGKAKQPLEIVIVFELPEDTAGIVRRYVLHSQLLARRLAAEPTR